MTVEGLRTKDGKAAFEAGGLCVAQEVLESQSFLKWRKIVLKKEKLLKVTKSLKKKREGTC
jgi:hypothetical protein